MATPAAEFQFEDKQWQALVKKLSSKWQDIKSRKEFGGITSAVVFKDIMEHFEQERGPDGRWQDWSESYEKHLQKTGRGGNKKLQYNGKLRQWFTPQSWRSKRDGILFYNNAQTKSGYPYAQGHDEGGTKAGRPPKRSFMWFSDKAMKSLVEITQKWLSE